MKIYVAGSSLEAEGIALYMRALRNAGHEITLDWTVPVLAATQRDRDLSEDDRLRHAHADLEAVKACEVFWQLVPATPSLGAWVELGAAAMCRPAPFIICSGDWRRSLFTSMAHERFDSHGEAYDRIWPATRAA